MVVHSLDVKKDPFHPYEKGEESHGPKVSYHSDIGALMYCANFTRPYIAFAINLLVKYDSASTQRHWNDIKHILHYLQETIDMGLFYSKKSKQQ